MSTSGVSSSTSSTSTTETSSATTTDRLSEMDMSVFLELMITELQNQDPLNPMENSEMLNQIGQIREISSNDKLSETLESVLMGNDLMTASGLIGKQIKGLNSDAEYVTGTVDKVTVADDAITLTVGEDTVDLSNVSEILPAETAE